MATGLQVKNITQIISGGYDGEAHGFTGTGYNDWTDVSLNGSVELSYYYSDSDSGTNANSSRVYVTVKDTWTTTKDSSTNKLTIQVVTTLVSVSRGSLVGSPGSTGRFMRTYDDKNGTLIWSGTGYPNVAATYLSSPGITLATRTITLNPVSEAGKGTIYYKGGLVGHESDATPSIYIDEFYMGTQFKNVLPDKPPKPTVTLSSQTPVGDCDDQPNTINAIVKITQQNYGAYGTETAYARYKVGSGSWSSYSRVTTQKTGNYTITGLPAATTITVESYSTGDGTESDHTTMTFTTPSRPTNATIAFASQTAESDQLTVRANLTYTQPINSAHSNTKTFIRYKEGDGDWTDWKVVATNSASGAFTLRSLTPDRAIQVQVRSMADGLCSDQNTWKTITFYTPTPIKAPTHSSFSQTDTGSCINVTMPWSQTDASRFTTVHTYYSYHIDNGAWTDWTEQPSPTSGTDSISCVPYGSTICVRTYSLGDGLRGETTEACITVSEATVDDTPYKGDTFLVESTCDSLQYLAELICQEWYAIKDGDRIVYTNEEHKEHCDGDEDDPTLHSMLSRIYRYFGAIVCLICNGLNDDFNFYKRGATQTVLQSAGDGEYSEWVEPDTKVTKDSTHLVTSDGIWKAIDEFIHTAYYYVGDWDYLTYNPSTLADVKDKKTGDTALVKNGAGGTNQTYTYNGSSWVAGTVNDLDDFDMVHVNKESTFTVGLVTTVIPAGSGWYWYNNNWNHLDASSASMQEEISDLLDSNLVMKQDTNEEDMQFAVLTRNADGSVTAPIVPSAKTIYFITEDI